MSWAKIDDRANEHWKQLEAGAEACWLWACGLMYANRQPARDGFVPEKVVGMLYPFAEPAELARQLVKAKLWKKAPGGYLIHEFTVWNQTKEEREEQNRKGRERAAKSYRRRKPKNKKSSPEEKAKTEPKSEAKNLDSSGSASAPLPIHSATTPDPVVAVVDKARKALANPHDGQYSRPSTWPEVVAICEAWSFGMRIKLRDFVNSDSDLRAILEAIAAEEFTVEQLVLAGELAKKSEYFAKLDRPGPASFTPAVLRRLLGGATAKPANDDETGGYGPRSEWAL